MRLSGNKTKAVVFPVGGIGSGSIGLAGNGALVDWEIFNRPAQGSRNGFSHFAIRAQRGEKFLDARVLNSDLQAPLTGAGGGDQGPVRETMGGLPHFPESVFTGMTPFASLDFLGSRFPGKVKLTGWNPMIPANDRDSSIPAAFYEVTVENTETEETEYSVFQTVCNPYEDETARNTAFREGKIQGVLLSSGRNKDDLNYGEITMATDAEDVSIQEYWIRGVLFDQMNVYIRELAGTGKLSERRYEDGSDTKDHATIAVSFRLQPGAARTVRFVTGWYMPNRENDWNPPSEGSIVNRWKNYYASLFADSKAVSTYALKEYDRLKEESLRFSDALYSSTMPEDCIEAIECNLATLKTPTCMRLTDGEFYGFEGCHPAEGSCEGSCTHVWNYAYALPFLFPKLERSMRTLDYQYSQDDKGGMHFRLQLPIGRKWQGFRPCIDGQFGDILKVYRDWRLCGDDEWLKSLWPRIKKSIAYAWSPENPDRWDPERSGMLTGRQHNTADAELFGPNSWMEGFYLGALKAAAEMGEYLGDNDAKLYRELFEKGRKQTDGLFNGEYFIQKVDLNDKHVLDPYPDINEWAGKYWSEETGEIRLQLGEGCAADQMGSQWHCDLIGLGDIFDPEKVHSALAAVYKNNYKKSMRDEWNAYRLFTLNDEGALMVCSWPEGAYQPMMPLLYAHEVWYGLEYAVASHMVRRGLEKEGLEVLHTVRDRFDGEKRNPWNEFECGSHYARNMSCYAFLLVYSGFVCDMSRKKLSFAPLHKGDCSFFWSMDSAWGVFTRKNGAAELRVLYGSVELNTVSVDGKECPVGKTIREGESIRFPEEENK